MIREVDVFHLGDVESLYLLGILWQSKLARLVLEDGSQALLAVDHVIPVGRRTSLAPIEFRDVVSAQNRINQQLLLPPAPYRRSLEVRVCVDARLDSTHGQNRPRFLADVHSAPPH